MVRSARCARLGPARLPAGSQPKGVAHDLGLADVGGIHRRRLLTRHPPHGAGDAGCRRPPGSNRTSLRAGRGPEAIRIRLPGGDGDVLAVSSAAIALSMPITSPSQITSLGSSYANTSSAVAKWASENESFPSSLPRTRFKLVCLRSSNRMRLAGMRSAFGLLAHASGLDRRPPYADRSGWRTLETNRNLATQ